jgi:hypothetical protein
VSDARDSILHRCIIKPYRAKVKLAYVQSFSKTGDASTQDMLDKIVISDSKQLVTFEQYDLTVGTSNLGDTRQNENETRSRFLNLFRRHPVVLYHPLMTIPLLLLC